MTCFLRVLALIGMGSTVAAAASQPQAEPPAARNVTFISTSDSHYTAFDKEDRNERVRDTLRQINAATGLQWPDALGGGPVEKPRGVLLLGDVIDDGDKLVQGKNYSAQQYSYFLTDFGLDGSDGLLKYPVFEGWGNHDGPPAGKEKHGFSFQAHLKKRNAARLEKKLVSDVSENGLHYSWDWDDVHFVQLNIYAADRQREGIRYNPVWHDPQDSLTFMKQTLAKHVGQSGRPVVLLTHCGVDTDWWSPDDWKEFYEAARPYNVVLYLYGHSGTGIRQWAPPGEEKKWLCINDGQTENGFFIIQITGDRLRAAYRCKENVRTIKNEDKTMTREWDGTWGWRWAVERKLTGDMGVKTPALPAPRPASPRPPPAPKASEPQAVAPIISAPAVSGAVVLLDAESLRAGPLTEWNNTGSLGQAFVALPGANLKVEDVAGRRAVVFKGEGGLRATFNAPAWLTGAKAFTVATWIRPERLSGKGVIAAWGSRPDGFVELGYGHGREGAFASKAGRGPFAPPPSSRRWQQITYAYAEGQLTVYVNGEINTKQTCSLAIKPDAAMHLGTAWDAAKAEACFGFRGAVARLEIWDRALSHREVRNLHGDLAPFAHSPADGALLDARSTTLRWQPGHADARAYRVHLSTGRDTIDPGRRAMSAAINEANTGELALGQICFWQVEQLDGSGRSLGKGPVLSFRVSDGPATRPQPRNRVASVRADCAELSWQPGQYAVSQDLHFGTTAEEVARSTTPVIRNLAASVNRVPMPQALAPGRTYYWRVDQNNGPLPSAKGEVWAFRVVDEPIAEDVTFFIVSDTHYGLDVRGDRIIPQLIDQMNWLPGAAYPDELGGGFVRTPRGVIHCGDVTNDGAEEQWRPFVRDFGLNGEGRLVWPVYEAFGNHDGGVDSAVRRGIKQRNTQRTGLAHISANGMHYSWDWDHVHLINLNISVGDTFRPYYPQHSYDFLVSDLAQHGHKRLILLQHFGFDRHSLTWWEEEARRKYHEAIKGRNILGIFHGHDHNTGVFKWNGIDIFNLPHLRVSETEPEEPAQHGFFIVRITATEMIVIERRLDGTWGMSLRKPLTGR